MKRTTLKAAAAKYRAYVTKDADACLTHCGYDIEQAFRAGWSASTANRWPKAKITKRRRAHPNGDAQV